MREISDYIKRDDAIEYLVDNMVWMDADGIETSEEDKRDAIAELINGVPSADVAQVRRGRWINDAGAQKCSVCRMSFSDLHPLYERVAYCPNCGAKTEDDK